MSLFSKNLRYLRNKGNYKQGEISALFNKQANTVGNWENKKSEPSLAELIKLGAFFKIGVQEFLNNDLESSATHYIPETDQPDLALKSSSAHGSVPGQSTEGSQEAFWVILRELRSLHEKVDLLTSGKEFVGFQKASDKSSH